jgi:hypothetical protein
MSPVGAVVPKWCQEPSFTSSSVSPWSSWQTPGPWRRLRPDVGPHGQLEALEPAIIPAAGKDLAQVALKRARLDAAEHRHAGGPNVQRAAPDPIVRVGARPVPGFAVPRWCQTPTNSTHTVESSSRGSLGISSVAVVGVPLRALLDPTFNQGVPGVEVSALVGPR